MENDLTLGPDLSHDPAVHQVVQSPANTMHERYEVREMCSGADMESRHRLPAEDRSYRRSMNSPGIMVSALKIKGSRSSRSRR